VKVGTERNATNEQTLAIVLVNGQRILFQLAEFLAAELKAPSVVGNRGQVELVS